MGMENWITMKDASKVTGLSMSSLYKLTAKRVIGFYKPFGKKIFFSEQQISDMMTGNRISSIYEVEAELFKNKLNKKVLN